MWNKLVSRFKWLGQAALVAAIAVPMTMSAPSQAQAGSGWSPGAAAAVGIIGGLALGAALSDHHHYSRDYYDEPYYPRGRVVYYPRSYYYDDPYCYHVRERVWVPGYGWDYHRRTVCD